MNDTPTPLRVLLIHEINDLWSAQMLEHDIAAQDALHKIDSTLREMLAAYAVLDRVGAQPMPKKAPTEFWDAWARSQVVVEIGHNRNPHICYRVQHPPIRDRQEAERANSGEGCDD